CYRFKKAVTKLWLRIYNRFEKETGYLLRPSAEQVIYKQKFTLPQVAKGKVHTVVVKQNNLPSIHKDTELSNLKVEAK
ncbi:glycoside hydrolase family 29 protein, partial [human gut metagenome]